MAKAFAWTGGALFVVALGTLVYFYAIILARPAPATGRSLTASLLIDIALFSVFALHHSLLARTRAKLVVTALVPPRLERSLYVWVASTLAIVMCLLWQPLPGVIYSVDSGARWLLYALQGAGLLLTWRGAAVVDALDLAGIRQLDPVRREDTFRVVGPFRFVRHPIYLGWMLMVFAAPEMTTGRFVFAAISSLYLLIAIPFEERSLVAAFGDRYRAYQADVRWRVLPGVY